MLSEARQKKYIKIREGPKCSVLGPHNLGQGAWAPAVPLDLHLPDNIFPVLFSYRETSLAKCVMTETFSTKLNITWIALTSQDITQKDPCHQGVQKLLMEKRL